MTRFGGFDNRTRKGILNELKGVYLRLSRPAGNVYSYGGS